MVPTGSSVGCVLWCGGPQLSEVNVKNYSPPYSKPTVPPTSSDSSNMFSDWQTMTPLVFYCSPIKRPIIVLLSFNTCLPTPLPASDPGSYPAYYSITVHYFVMYCFIPNHTVRPIFYFIRMWEFCYYEFAKCDPVGM